MISNQFNPEVKSKIVIFTEFYFEFQFQCLKADGTRLLLVEVELFWTTKHKHLITTSWKPFDESTKHERFHFADDFSFMSSFFDRQAGREVNIFLQTQNEEKYMKNVESVDGVF